MIQEKKNDYFPLWDAFFVDYAIKGEAVKDEKTINHEIIAEKNRKRTLDYIEWKSKRVREYTDLMKLYHSFDYEKIVGKEKFKKSVWGRINNVLMEDKYQLTRNFCKDIEMEIFTFLKK
jgi:hypothetical protein